MNLVIMTEDQKLNLFTKNTNQVLLSNKIQISENR